MLLWINGPFGGGKTQTAAELHRRLPGSVICDPEDVGFGLHRMMPAALRSDFQDLRAWRQGVYEVLDLAVSKHDGTVIVPMTMIEPGYFRETVGRLRDRGRNVRHFSLLADRDTVLRRLRQRSVVHSALFLGGKDTPVFRESFAVSKLDLCLERLAGQEFATQLRTDRMTVPQVAEQIAASAGLVLIPNNDSTLRGSLRRTWTSLKHIRFD